MSAIKLIAILALLSSCVFAQSRTVAITIDDLPVAGKANRFEIETINSALMKALQKHKVPATVFVNEQGLETMGIEAGTRLLQSWLRWRIAMLRMRVRFCFHWCCRWWRYLMLVVLGVQ